MFFLQVGIRIRAKAGLGSRDIMARPATGGGARARPGGSMTALATMRREVNTNSARTNNNLYQGSAEDYDDNYEPPCIGQYIFERQRQTL